MNFSEVKDALYKESVTKQECRIATILEKHLFSIPGFGCSDCRCKSHLFYGSHKNITHAVKDLHLKRYKLKK
ncbi:MAG: hypothetical protein A3K77_02330 [Euryarchaeota archaeon RBG_13_31_8]|nr:MAG: hypothetical protein A3K77_02330 [Euryarchaeota archaeon RBG_13_31_8]